MSPPPALAFIPLFFLVFQAVATAQTPSVDKIRALLESEEPSIVENLKAAEESCRLALRESPGDVSYSVLLAEALRGQERLDEIAVALSPAIDAHPRATEPILLRALANQDLGQFEKVLEDGERLANLGFGMGNLLIAQASREAGLPMRELKSLTRLMDLYPEGKRLSEWKYSRAQRLTDFHLYDWAESDLRASIESEWAPLKVLLLGEVLARQHRWEEAQVALEEVFERTDPSRHFIGHLRQMNVLLQMDEIEKVQFLFKRYDENYANTEAASRADKIRASLSQRLAVIEELKRAAKDQKRPSGFESEEDAKADRLRMQQLRSSTTSKDIDELKTLLIRHAQFGMESEEIEYATVMLKLLADGASKFRLTDSEVARKTTVQSWLQIQQDNPDMALKEATQATESDPNFGDAWRMRGLAAYLLDDNDRALEHLSRAVELDPLNYLSLGLRALINTDLGNTQQAATDLHRAGEIAPNNPWLASARAHFFETVDERNASLRNQCQANAGNTPERCEHLLDAGLPELVVPDVFELRDQGIDVDPAWMSGIIARASYQWFAETLQYETGGLSAGQLLQVCVEAETKNPEEPLYPSMLADAHRFQGNYAESARWTEQALELAPTSAPLLYQLASLHLAEGNRNGAKELVQRMKQADYSEDQEASALRDEMAIIVEQAEDLAATLETMKFATETGKSLETLLAQPQHTASVFTAEHARKIDRLYEQMRPQAIHVSSPQAGSMLRLSCISTEDLKSQNHTLFDFDEQLAEIAPRLKDGYFWFTVKYTAQNEVLGKSFAYFVKLEDGWRVFPEPWSVD
ncbi:MAG: tetratricopeptide repeat protein [Planctomycetota bacterium]